MLIGVQFTDKDRIGRVSHTNIELYVVRDITLMQLMDGIKYGLAKLAKSSSEYADIYKRCFDILSRCLSETFVDRGGQVYFKNITFTSFNATVIGKEYRSDERFAFSVSDTEKALCDLGFITSSRIIFDATGSFVPRGSLNVDNVVEAFNPRTSQKIFFPEYNISSRQLYQFDNTPVDIVAPTDPPQKPNNSLIGMLLPSMISLVIMMLVRVIMSSTGTGSGLTMILLSAAMGVSTVITTTMSWKKQRKEYEKNLRSWRAHYEKYTDSVLLSIQERQARDVKKLEALYPDMLSLIKPDSQGVYSMNEHIYSRCAQDADFLTFRIGYSDDVPSFFQINHDNKDVVFSEAFFDIVTDNTGHDRLRVFLRKELQGTQHDKENLCKLSDIVSKRYAYLKKAPLLYSLKNKGCLGIVDKDVASSTSKSNYFISRMIFELCYYHAPEDLQFVVFFNKEHDWDNIENAINRYKFMPHFRGLFSDKSQFVFDKESAHLIMSSLLTMLGARQKGMGARLPHIVMLVFEEYGLKEHAFAEYLPKAPAEGTVYTNDLGISFIFATKYKEYLPAYCNDIVRFEDYQMSLTPHENVAGKQVFTYDYWSGSSSPRQFYIDYTQSMIRAMRFFSSVYYAQIAQNGKVPSSVSMYEVINPNKSALNDVICANWGLNGKRTLPSITKSLCVPIGKTESGFAYLDLHEKADGPHMLVAGTTGSGKTETIISYLLGLCMQYRPDELNLLLVDMKGGGFTKRIGHLPHVVGSVTDVDGDENGTSAEYMLGRFLYAMKSEIKRRKLLFNKLHVDSIDGYIQACANIEAHIEQKKLTGEEAAELRKTAKTDPLSHLILVVDEFTELKRFSNENGEMDFMGEITTIARVGRSLGLHIILISQNIEGAITDDIRVNSNARLCLKVATRQASKDMIGTDLAASPHMPGNGRAYLLVGTGQKFEYFQSAYSGAGVEESIPIEISLASKTGSYAVFYRSDKDNTTILKRLAEQKKLGTAKSQLELICDAICETYSAHKPQLATPHIVFSNPLSSCIAWDSAQDCVIDLNKRKLVNE